MLACLGTIWIQMTVRKHMESYELRLFKISPGILVLGGESSTFGSKSVEFWSTVDPEEGSCLLKDYPREMRYIHLYFLIQITEKCSSAMC